MSESDPPPIGLDDVTSKEVTCKSHVEEGYVAVPFDKNGYIIKKEYPKLPQGTEIYEIPKNVDDKEKCYFKLFGTIHDEQYADENGGPSGLTGFLKKIIKLDRKEQTTKPTDKTLYYKPKLIEEPPKQRSMVSSLLSSLSSLSSLGSKGSNGSKGGKSRRRKSKRSKKSKKTQRRRKTNRTKK